MFVLPKMKVDPEEYRELVDQVKGSTSSGAAQPQQASPARQRRIAER